MLDKIKLLLGIEDEEYDALLSLMVKIAEEEVLAYTHLEDTDGLEYIIQMIVVEKFNKIGSEGIASKSYSGVSENINDGYSEPIKKLLLSKRKMRTI